MGLTIEVGYLADLLEQDEEGAEEFREDIEKLASFLPTRHLQPHREPERCPVFSVEMYGYKGLHYLRRFAANLSQSGSAPSPGTQNSAKDPVLQAYYKKLTSPPSLLSRLFGKKPHPGAYNHLINHSDAEGFYIPQEFDEVLATPRELRIPGLLIGSSHTLKRELEALAAALELPLDLDPESEAVWEAVEAQGEADSGWQRYGVESHTCLALHKAAEHSIKHSAAIVFA